MPTMNIEEYIETYGLDMDELSLALMRRLEHLDDVRRNELIARLTPESAKSAAHTNMLNLIDQAKENLDLARKLRESVVDGDRILGTVGDVQKALLAADRCLETSAKRFSAIYSIASQQALEEAVTEVMADMNQDTYEKFMMTLEDKLKNIR